REGFLGMWLGFLLTNYVATRRLGRVGGADTYFKIGPQLVRVPDVCFISWGRIGDRRAIDVPIAELAPELVIEVLSPSNTKGEMRLKRQHFFAAGTLVIWEVDPMAETITEYPAGGAPTVYGVGDTIMGGAALPDLTLALMDLFRSPALEPPTE
ncbi:MAG: Uma2 family endonuclease, partial [Gemmataceae bacterium]